MRQSKQQQILEIIERPNEPERGFLAREFVVCTLPHRDPKKPTWVKSNGDFSLVLSSGVDKRGEFIGLPSGSIPKLLLFWFVTSAIKTQSRHIQLGDSLNGFLREVGLDPKTGGGKRGDARRMKDELTKLVSCRISFIYEEGNQIRGSRSSRDMLLADTMVTWWDFANPEERSILECHITLSEAFYEAATRNPVPFDFRALVALKHSPLAIDLYTWSTWRVFAMVQRGEKQASVKLWGEGSLADQFGSQYGTSFHFKEALGEALEAVKMVWPQCDCELSATRLTLKAAPVPIATVDKRRKRRAFSELQVADVSMDARIWFLKEYPKHNGRAVLKAFKAFLTKNAIRPSDVDAMFKDYAAKWVQGAE